MHHTIDKALKQELRAVFCPWHFHFHHDLWQIMSLVEGRTGIHNCWLKHWSFGAQTACCFEWARWEPTHRWRLITVVIALGNERTTRRSCHLKHLELQPVLPTESAQLFEANDTHKPELCVQCLQWHQTADTKWHHWHVPVFGSRTVHTHITVLHLINRHSVHLNGTYLTHRNNQVQVQTHVGLQVQKPSQRHTRITHPFYSSTHCITKSLQILTWTSRNFTT